MRFTDFNTEYPCLAERALHSKVIVEEPFVYHLTRGQNIERQAIIDNPNFKEHWVIPTERGLPKSHRRAISSQYAKNADNIMKARKNQTKLLEEKQFEQKHIKM